MCNYLMVHKSECNPRSRIQKYDCRAAVAYIHHFINPRETNSDYGLVALHRNKKIVREPTTIYIIKIGKKSTLWVRDNRGTKNVAKGIVLDNQTREKCDTKTVALPTVLRAYFCYTFPQT